MNTEERKKTPTRTEKWQIKAIVRELENGLIKMFKGQRPFQFNRIRDRIGFILAIIEYCEKVIAEIGTDFAAFSDNVKEGVRQTGEIGNCTNTKFLFAKNGECFDGQHRTNWLYEFINNQFEIFYRGEFLYFKDLQAKYPLLAETFLKTEMDFVVCDTNDEKEIFKVFSEINSGSKNVTKEELVLSKYNSYEYECGKFYAKLLKDDGSFFKYSPVIEDIFRKNSQPLKKKSNSPDSKKQFIRMAAYITGNIEAKKSNNQTILDKFLDAHKDDSEEEFFESLEAVGACCSIIYNNKSLMDLCKKVGGHLTRALCKYIYLNFGESFTNDNGITYKVMSPRNKRKAIKFFEDKYEIINDVCCNFPENINDTYHDVSRTEKLFNELSLHL